MRTSFLPFSPPLIGEEEIAEVVDTLRSDWITTGPKVKRFEQEFAEYVGAPAAAALSSCTAALHVALAALGVGSGDLVLLSPITFCSAAHVIEQVGAVPVFVDVEPDTLNLDPVAVCRVLEALQRDPNTRGKTKAIMPVHLYGHPAEMDKILEIAREFKLAIVEDAAHALPAGYKGRKIGTLPDTDVPVLTAFSFYATKNMTTAEGGMLTGPAALVDEARIWGLHGMSRDAWKRYSSGGSWYYEVIRPGFKYNMTDLQASLGLHQLRKLSAFHARRREVVEAYNRAFAGLPGVRRPASRSEVEHAWHLYVLRIESASGTTRDDFIRDLTARNIGSSVHFIPVHMHPYYRDKYGFKPEDFPVAYSAFQQIVSLPLSPRLSDEDVNDVIEAVQAAVSQARPNPTCSSASV